MVPSILFSANKEITKKGKKKNVIIYFLIKKNLLLRLIFEKIKIPVSYSDRSVTPTLPQHPKPPSFSQHYLRLGLYNYANILKCDTT